MQLWISRILRWIFGGWFLLSGAIYLAARLGADIELPSDSTAGAAAFMNALRESGFINELMFAGFFSGGAALLFDRSAPLGLVILGPFITVIFFYHLVLTGNWPWGSAWAGIFVVLLWLYRERLSALWTRPE